MTKTGMIKLYREEKGWVQARSDALWNKWLSEGRKIVPDEDDGQATMFVKTEIYADEADSFSMADKVQTGMSDKKKVSVADVEAWVRDMQDTGEGLTAEKLEGSSATFGSTVDIQLERKTADMPNATELFAKVHV